MGRYSQRLAAPFADFAGVRAGMRALDVGAGTGALTAELFARLGSDVAAAEPSPDFVETLRARFPGIEVQQASAEALPWGDGYFDAALSQLVISFLTDPVAGAREQRRVTCRGGLVAVANWERDGIEALQVVWEVQRELRMRPPSHDGEGSRSQTERELRSVFAGAGVDDVTTTTIEVETDYASFDEFWDSALASAGPNTRWVRAATEGSADLSARGREVASEALGRPRGAFTLHARAVCARGLA